MARLWLVAGSLAGFLSVAGGAFGAHALKQSLEPQLLATFETGARYAMYHALALLAVGLLARARPSRAATVAGGAFLAGVFLFTGSLWALALSGVKQLGMITPFGGAAFLIGWLALATAAWGLGSPGAPDDPA